MYFIDLAGKHQVIMAKKSLLQPCSTVHGRLPIETAVEIVSCMYIPSGRPAVVTMAWKNLTFVYTVVLMSS
jgi:hypothetical protein